MFSNFKTLIVVLILLSVLTFESNFVSPEITVAKQESISTFSQKKCVAIASTPVSKSPIQTISQRNLRTFTHILIQIIYKDFTDLKVFKRSFDIKHFKPFENTSFYKCRLFFHKF